MITSSRYKYVLYNLLQAQQGRIPYQSWEEVQVFVKLSDPIELNRKNCFWIVEYVTIWVSRDYFNLLT